MDQVHKREARLLKPQYYFCIAIVIQQSDLGRLSNASNEGSQMAG